MDPLVVGVILTILFFNDSSGCQFVVQDRCLKLSPTEVNYEESLIICHEMGGRLTAVEEESFSKNITETISASMNFTAMWVEAKNTFLMPGVKSSDDIKPTPLCGMVLDSSGNSITPIVHTPSELLIPCPDDLRFLALCDVTKPCTPPPTVDNMKLLTHPGNYKSGEKAIYQCNNGYVESGSKYQTHIGLKCLSSGEWSNTLPACFDSVDIKIRYEIITTVNQYKKLRAREIRKLRPLILKCLEDDGLSVAMWTKDGLDLQEYNTTLVYETEKNNLQIMAADVIDSGRYTCYVNSSENHIMPYATYEISLFNNKYGTSCYDIYKSNTDYPKVILYVGGSTVLHCGESSSTTEYRWYKDNRLLFGNEQQIILDDGSLFLKNVTVDFNGHYTCINDENSPECRATSDFIIYDVTVFPELKEYCGIVKQDNVDSALQYPRPWLVHLIRFYQGRQRFCHGTLIDYRTVVTSASCFKEMNITEFNIDKQYGIYSEFSHPFLGKKSMFDSPRLSLSVGGPFLTPKKDVSHKHLIVAVKNYFQGVFFKQKTNYEVNLEITDVEAIHVLPSASKEGQAAIIKLTTEMKPLDYQGLLRPICITSDVLPDKIVYHSIFRSEPYDYASFLMAIEPLENCLDIEKQKQPITQFCAKKLSSNETDIPLLPGSPLEVYENGRWYLGGIFTHFNHPYYYFINLENIESLLKS